MTKIHVNTHMKTFPHPTGIGMSVRCPRYKNLNLVLRNHVTKMGGNNARSRGAVTFTGSDTHRIDKLWLTQPSE